MATKDPTRPNDTRPNDPELEILLEAARRANWDALHGPRHLRSGRFNPGDEDRGGPDMSPPVDAETNGARPDQPRITGPSDETGGSS